MASALVTLSITANVQVSEEGQPEVSMTTDSEWSTNSELLNYQLTKISVLLNESSNTSGFVEKPVNAFDNNGDLLPKIILGSPDISLGKHYLIRLRYMFSHQTNNNVKYVETATKSVYIKSVPQTPSTISAMIRPDDAGLSINIASLYTRLSESDGYDEITHIIFYIAKVDGTTDEDLIQGEIELDFVDGTRKYNNWYSIDNLVNGQQYEVALRVQNSMGQSGLSETTTVAPSDLPAQITHTKAVNNFNDLVDPVTTSQSSTVKFYWSKPSDYNTLNSGESPVSVTSYTIRKQEVVYNPETLAYEATGDPVETELTHDANSELRPNYELSSPVEDDIDSTILYDYAYSYSMTPSDYGKVFQFTVFATNANGSGPESDASNRIASFINPSPQTFSLEHQTEEVSTIGVPVKKYTGKLDLTISSLSELNGMADVLETSVGDVYEEDGITPFKVKNVEMELTVKSDEETPVLILGSTKVTFIEQYTTENVEVTIDGNTATRTVATRSNEWRINDIASNITGFGTLNKGTKYSFSLKRLGKNPLDTTTEFKSTAEELLRTYFESPASVSEIQAYSINDDFTPVTLDGSPAIRIAFKQISNTDMNGTDAFISDLNPLEYEIRANSQPIPGMERITHDSTSSDGLREFVIASSLGNVANLYIRVYIYNTELDAEIEGEESSPAVSESAKTYPSAVTNLTTTVATNGQSVSVNWTKQSLSGLGGFFSSNAGNTVYLFNDTTGSAVDNIEVAYTAAVQSHSFTGLILGNVYKIYVVAYGIYSKGGLTEVADDKYVSAMIRQNYVTEAFTAVGNPGVPTNVEAFPGADNVTFYYDAVADNELNGNVEGNLVYHFILNSDNTHFPYQDADSTLLQESVAHVSGTDEAVISKAYTSVLESNDRLNASPLETETLYNYAVYVVSNVGNEPINNQTDILDEDNATQLTMTSVTNTPSKNVMGSVHVGAELLYINNNVPKPSVTASAGEGTITLNITKPADVPSEMVVTMDNNDAVDADGNDIVAFDTRNVRDALVSASGLFSLENADKTSPIGGIDYGVSGYNFNVTTSNNQQIYTMKISNLVNGRTHKVQVRFAKTFDNNFYFGEETVVEIAAEAPPTIPLAQEFSVDDKVIDLEWSEPSNTGGAGIGENSELLYKITMKNNDNNDIQVLEIDNISDTFYQINTSNFADLANGTSYRIEIEAYYVKNGNVVSSAPAIINAIKPNPSPLSPNVTVTRLSNSLKVDITTVSEAQSLLYPLTGLSIYSKKSSEPNTNYILAKTFDITDLINDGSKQLSFTIANLFNGESYDIKVTSTPNYTYAQAPSDVVNAAQIPFGKPTVNASSATQITGNSKAITLTVSLNGSGNITNIIALGKSSNSSVIGILSLSSSDGNLPTITTSGIATSEVAASQTATFTLDFGATIPSGLADAIIVVSTINGTDAGAYSTSAAGSQYFVDDLQPAASSDPSPPVVG